jgi:hypothetical protein
LDRRELALDVLVEGDENEALVEIVSRIDTTMVVVAPAEDALIGGRRRAGLDCSEALHGSQLVLSCKVADAPPGDSAIRVRLYHGSTLLANESGAVHAGRAAVKLALGPRHSRRSYTLKVTLDAAGAVSSQISHLTLH